MLNAREHELDGKKIDPKVAFPKRTQDKVGEQKEHRDNRHSQNEYHSNHDEFMSNLMKMMNEMTATEEQVMYYEQSKPRPPRNRNEYRSKI